MEDVTPIKDDDTIILSYQKALELMHELVELFGYELKEIDVPRNKPLN